MDKQKTGELIKSARIKKGYTQVELGDLLGVTNKAISRWEKGDSFPDIGVIEELSRILDIRIQDIVIGEIKEKNTDSETAVTEVVRVAKLQDRVKKRELITGIVAVIIVGYMLMCGWYSFRGHIDSSGMYYLGISLAVILVVVFLKERSRRPGLPDHHRHAGNHERGAPSDHEGLRRGAGSLRRLPGHEGRHCQGQRAGKGDSKQLHSRSVRKSRQPQGPF